ncbi:MAG TPA: trypsin-like peptidase domain-containing protein [Mariprofundaceae bacterium]|nr:trypsin-like peptidase domain-containing protein [Mariprofundaceae bacterium]
MRSLPEDNLAYPVLVVLDSGGMGTACVINCPEANYLATAKHVLFDSNNNLRAKSAVLKSYTPKLIESDFTQVTLDLNVAMQNGNIQFHDTHDVCLVRMFSKSYPNEMGPGVVINVISSKGIAGVNIDTTFKYLDEVMLSNDVYIFGYPASIGLRNSPQFNSEMPLLRKGTVAGKNNTNKTIILDCPVYQGNSGGPVIEVEAVPNLGGIAFKLIGIVSQFVPAEEHWRNMSFGITNVQWSNSGYSVVEPTDFIKELIEKFKPIKQA